MKAALSKVVDYFKNMDKKRRTWLIVLTVLILIVVISVSVIMNQKTWSVLYSGMEQADAAQVLTRLKDMGVDAKAQGTDTILVSSGDLDSLRLQLAAEGYPSSGLNYDIYQNASGLGVTDAEKRIYYQYQLQENLRKTIMQMDKVKDAVVNIDLGEQSSYVLSDSGSRPPTASIMLKLKGNAKLDNTEVKAIAELVTKSISGLEISNVQIVDSRMNFYTVKPDNETETYDTDAHMELEASVQNQMQQQVINLLSPVFGKDNVLAQVDVVLDFDKKVTQSVEYAQPEGNPDGIASSMKELAETITNGTSAGSAGAANASPQYVSTLTSDPNAVYYNVSREVNYQVNQTTTQIEKAQGQIKDISVSIILNSDNVDNYSEQVKKLVSTAIGASEDRITVEMLPFAKEDGVPAAVSDDIFDAQQKVLSGARSEETTRIMIYAAAGVIVLIFLFAIIMVLRRRPEIAAQGAGFEYVADEEIVPEPPPKENIYADIKLDKKDDNLSVLQQFASENPESVANLLRNWLNED